MTRVKIYVNEAGKNVVLTSYLRKGNATLEEAYDIGYHIIKNMKRKAYVNRIDVGNKSYSYSKKDVHRYLEYVRHAA
jgi:hypothetical protein